MFALLNFLRIDGNRDIIDQWSCCYRMFAMSLRNPIRQVGIVVAVVTMLSACAQQSLQDAPDPEMTGVLLTNEAIFKDRRYKAKVPGTIL